MMNLVLRSNPAVRPGFSLMELLAVVTILGILAAIVVPRVAESGDHAKEQVCQHHQGQLNSLLERYYLQNGVAATAISDIEGAGQELVAGTAPICPISGAAYKVDPATGHVEPHVEGGSHNP